MSLPWSQNGKTWPPFWLLSAALTTCLEFKTLRDERKKGSKCSRYWNLGFSGAFVAKSAKFLSVENKLQIRRHVYELRPSPSQPHYNLRGKMSGLPVALGLPKLPKTTVCGHYKSSIIEVTPNWNYPGRQRLFRSLHSLFSLSVSVSCLRLYWYEENHLWHPGLIEICAYLLQKCKFLC